MPRLSARDRVLRETRDALLRAFIAGRTAFSTELEQETERREDGSADSNDSSCSSSELTVSSLSSSSSSALLSTASNSSQLSGSTGADLECIGMILRALESRRVLNEPRLPRGVEPLISRLDRLRQSDRVGDAAFFRRLVRMGPEAFDGIVQVIESHPVFAVKNPKRVGASVAEQVAVAFYWMGRFGNGGGVSDVAAACGCAEGSVVKYTAAVTTALYDARAQVLCWASEEEKADAKAWVASRSGCLDFGDGFSMVDGSLVPLAFAPSKNAYQREYYDRKGQYSLNVQSVVLPTTLRIVDYVVGYKGSTQDSRAFAASDVVKRPRLYLEEGEFVWTDSGYGYSEFTCGPYDHTVAAKSRDFRRYNYAVSNVRVRSEHAFGYLKGRFQCLRGLRLLVRDEDDHHRLTITVVAAMVAHNLALRWDGDEERRCFVDVSDLSDDARRVWIELQSISQEEMEREQAAWTRRLRAHTQRESVEGLRRARLSQSRLDEERRDGGKQLRERLHVALFASKHLTFEDTTPESRKKDMTETEWRRWDARQRQAQARSRRG